MSWLESCNCEQVDTSKVSSCAMVEDWPSCERLCTSLRRLYCQAHSHGPGLLAVNTTFERRICRARVISTIPHNCPQPSGFPLACLIDYLAYHVTVQRSTLVTADRLSHDHFLAPAAVHDRSSASSWEYETSSMKRQIRILSIMSLLPGPGIAP
jgi:hypothetical protein